jgi:hypothetical protein
VTAGDDILYGPDERIPVDVHSGARAVRSRQADPLCGHALADAVAAAGVPADGFSRSLEGSTYRGSGRPERRRRERR